MQFVRGGPDIPEHLLQAHEDGRVVFFCGAGISYPARLPGFKDLVDKLYSDLKPIPNPVQQAAIRAKGYDTAVGLLESDIVDGRRTVRERIARILQPDTSAPNATATHQALLTLSKCRDRRTRLITTNFDRLFEHVIAEDRIPVEGFEAPLLPVPKSRWDGLVYLHGLLPEDPAGKDLDNLVVSSGDFGLAYLNERWAARFVSELLRNFVVCFVGYSIDDPVLRYMMDALAADRLLGESTPEMFAFGVYSKGEETGTSNEWRAKNVTPILYRAHRGHLYLHRTLRAWADTYRDGAQGKERIVVEYAKARPGTASGDDDFVNRMLWALSDASGLPARRFADLDPVPSLDWLEPLSRDGFRHKDLIRFGVPPREEKNEDLAFSLARRPAPYDLAPQMALADTGMQRSRFDNVMWGLTRWLSRHLNDPQLLLWLVKQGGRLHPEMSRWISLRMNEIATLEQQEDHEALERIRRNAPRAIPGARMRTLWGLLMTNKVKRVGDHLDVYGWWRRFEREGLTLTLRLELRQMLTPLVTLREPFRWPPDAEAEEEAPRNMRQLVDWNIALSAGHVRASLRHREANEHWNAALPMLLSDFTSLLRETLDLMRALEGADDRSDLSYSSQRSISEHPQNTGLRDWTALIEFCRDAWVATKDEVPAQARIVAETWSKIRYPLFRRLAFFAAAQGDTIPCALGLTWLLEDEHWWLWSAETQREAMRLLVALVPRLEDEELATLERAVLAGPPREMYRPDLEEERWNGIQDRDIWVRLAKMSAAGGELSDLARNRLSALSERYPAWVLADNQREEFPTWSGDGREWRVHIQTPRERAELIEWLREHPETDDWQSDDWAEVCRDDFDNAAHALAELANEENWPKSRWGEALQQWSSEELKQRSWREMARVVNMMPEDRLEDLSHPVSYWLEKIADTFEGEAETFLALCDRVLVLDYEVEDEIDDDPVGHAINHQVGNVAEGLLHWWYRSDLRDGQGLTEDLKSRFSRLCDTGRPKFRHARVLLAAHVISLFTVDRGWTTEFMLPLFDWENSEAEARAVWEGFLWSPRIYPPLMEVLKPSFLNTANHYDRLGRHGEQYAALLTFLGVDPGDFFEAAELRAATAALPQEGLDHCAETLCQAVNGAGEQRADFWRNRAAPYLNRVWPRSREMMSRSISTNFSLACVAAGEAFPDALQGVRPWVQPVQYPDRIAEALREAEMDTRFPERALELLHRTVGGDDGEFVLELGDCLRAIREAEAALEEDHRFQRLRQILRANGRDLE